VRRDGIQDERIQPLAGVLIDMLKKGPSHAGIPEATEVVGGAFQRLGPIGERGVKGTDLVGHRDEVVDIHRAG
jgi:hypothetical protein